MSVLNAFDDVVAKATPITLNLITPLNKKANAILINVVNKLTIKGNELSPMARRIFPCRLVKNHKDKAD